jgi:hypothetical protein
MINRKTPTSPCSAPYGVAGQACSAPRVPPTAVADARLTSQASNAVTNLYPSLQGFHFLTFFILFLQCRLFCRGHFPLFWQFFLERFFRFLDENHFFLFSLFFLRDTWTGDDGCKSPVVFPASTHVPLQLARCFQAKSDAILTVESVGAASSP